MNGILSERSMRALTDAIGNLLDAQARLGGEMVSTMMSSGGMGLCSCCDIPEPCWMPQSAGEVVSSVCPAATATLRLEVTNCGADPRVVQISAAGASAGSVSIQPTTLALGPKESATVTVTLQVPANAGEGHETKALIWVRGCREHYLRWRVRVSKEGGPCSHEVAIDDCPDLIHHWYDHFYCQRRCTHTPSSTVPGRG